MMTAKTSKGTKSTIVIGKFIKRIREELNLTRRQVASSLGYAWPNFVGMLETGSGKFPLDRWTRFADVLKVPRHEFLKLVITQMHPDMLPHLIFKE